MHGIGGGHKQRYRMIDFLRFRPEQETKPGPFEEKVILVRYDPCRQVGWGVMMARLNDYSVAFQKCGAAWMVCSSVTHSEQVSRHSSGCWGQQETLDRCHGKHAGWRYNP